MGFYNMAAGDAPYFQRAGARAMRSPTTITSRSWAAPAPITSRSPPAMPPPISPTARSASRPSTRSRIPIRVRAPTTGTRSPAIARGSYVACADSGQPGVRAIRDYLATLPYKTFNDGNCEPGAYYLVNNYRPGFTAGRRAPRRSGPTSTCCRRRARRRSPRRLSAKERVAGSGISGGRNADGSTGDEYCDICDPLDAFDGRHDRAAAEQSRGASPSSTAISRPAQPAGGLLRHPAQYSSPAIPPIPTVARYEAFLQDAHRQGPGASGDLGRYRDPRHHGRGRRLLRQRLYPDPRFLRRRHAHPAPRRLALRQERRAWTTPITTTPRS